MHWSILRFSHFCVMDNSVKCILLFAILVLIIPRGCSQTTNFTPWVQNTTFGTEQNETTQDPTNVTESHTATTTTPERINSTSQADGSNDTMETTLDSELMTTPPTNETTSHRELFPPNPDGIPDFSVYKDGFVCARIQLHASTYIQYKTHGLGEIVQLSTETVLPQSAFSHGECHDNATFINISWENNTYMLSFTLVKEQHMIGELPSEINLGQWGVGSVELTIELRSPVFTNPALDDRITLQTTPHDGPYFLTPQNYSYSCAEEMEIPLAMYKDDQISLDVVSPITLRVWDFRVELFEGPSSGNFDTAVTCNEDISTTFSVTNRIPVIIAGCLSTIVCLIIIIYFIIIRRKSVPYSRME